MKTIKILQNSYVDRKEFEKGVTYENVANFEAEQLINSGNAIEVSENSLQLEQTFKTTADLKKGKDTKDDPFKENK